MANDVGGQHVSLWMIGAWISKGLGPELRKQGHDPCKTGEGELWRGPARDTPDPFQLGPVTMSVV